MTAEGLPQVVIVKKEFQMAALQRLKAEVSRVAERVRTSPGTGSREAQPP
jgi:hypothetical protein